MEYIKGRTNLSATIFVPYDCKNNCPFCTSKKDYFDINNLLSNIGRPVWYVFKCGTTITIKQDKIAEIDITNDQIIFKLNDSEYYIIYDYSGNVVENYWRVYFEHATALKNAQKLCLDK